jgi:HNH endonuclease
MELATRALVRNRARNCCEYCLLPQDGCSLTHHVEHIVPRQHGGSDDHGNLALACHRCNLRKGPNLTGIDPLTGEIVPLFDPRRDGWPDHFHFRGPVIEGVTAVGRTTVKLLSMNDTRRIERRELLERIPDERGGS